ncbi:MAG: type II toxin-antitoxin system RelE/ParE family toxin [Candidatus Hydrothermarchaeales archaeon]
MLEVRLHPEVVKFIKRLDDKIQKHIKEKLTILRSDPWRSRDGADIKKLSGLKGERICIA